MDKGKMDEGSEWAPLVSVRRDPPWNQVEGTYRGGLNGQEGANHIKDISETTDPLFITPAEEKLWDQLVGIMSPSLWEVKVSGGLQEGVSRVLSFSGSPKAILRAKEAISRLLIMVGSLFRVNTVTHLQTKHRTAGSFHLHEGLGLFLWEGEASRSFRVDAVMSLSTSGDKDCGNAVFAQRALNQQGFLHTKLDVFLGHPPIMELATAAVKLALEAASSRGLRSLLISCSDPAISSFQAEAITTGIEAFKRDHAASSLKNINFISSSRDDLAVFLKECGKLWSPGKNGQERLRNVLLSLEAVRIEVVAGSITKKKTDVAVIPLVRESDGLGWGPDVLAITRKALEVAPQAANLRPGEVLLVTASGFPQFDCRDLYLVQLEGSQLKCKNPQEAIRKMVWNCLSIFYGSFLESISFPVIEPVGPDQTMKGECLLVMLEEINRFLKEVPSTWMKLVQVVPLLERTPPCSVEDCFSAAVEPVGFCHPEDSLFLWYLNESPAAFHHFEVQLKEVGYRIQMRCPWGMVFQATETSVALHELGAAFRSVRDQYLLHCETRPEMLDSLLEQVTVLKEFPSIKIYSDDRMWLVGLSDEMTSLFQCLSQRAFQRQLVNREFTAEPLPRCTVAKDFLVQEMLPYNPLVNIDIIATNPATVRVWGRRQRVEEAEKRFKELLGNFYVQPVPLSKFQSEFVKVLWGELFHNDFCLKRGIPAVLEVSEVVQVAGLELDKMVEAEEIIMGHVGEKTVVIDKELQWATVTEEWKKLLHGLGSQREIALHHVAASQVTVVGISPHITHVEECIKEYLRENSEVLGSMMLARPELANAGQNLLHIMNWEHLKVTVKLQPNNQVLSLQVKGLQKYVRKAMPAIKIDLDSLVPATIPLQRATLSEYFSGTGAGLLMEMAQQCRCVVRMQHQQVPNHCDRGTNSKSSRGKRLAKDHVEVIHAVGRKSHVASLKQEVASFIAMFHEETISHEAIATFHDRFINELCKNTSRRYPIGLHHPGDELQIYGYQEDVGNLLEAIHRKIEKYQAECIEAEAQYETVPCIIVNESLVQGILPSNSLVKTEIIAEDPVTVTFRGPRQKVVELKKRFEEVLGDFQVLPVPLSDLQSQFVQAQWGKLFCNDFFIEQGILAVLEVSEVVQVAGLDLSTMKEAEEIIMRQVSQRTVSIAEGLKWATECEEWKALLHKLRSYKEVALHHVAPDQVTLVGICPHITEVEKSIKEYLQDNSSVEEKMCIPRAELALAGENLLCIMEWDDLNVCIQIQSGSQLLALQVTGLQKWVKEAIHVIRKDLNSLVCGTVPLKKTSLVGYFSGAGASWLQEIAEQQDCIVRVANQKSVCHSNGGTYHSRNRDQELAEEDHPVVVCVVGREHDVAFLKQQVADFIAKFHEETICSAEIATFSDEMLQELCNNTSHLFPVSFHLPREKVVQVAGSRDDVEKVLGAIYTLIERRVNAKIQKAQEVWIDSKILYETVRWHHATDDGWSTFDMATNRLLETEFGKKKMRVQVPWNGQKIDINLLKGEAVVPSNGKKFRIKREICLWDKNIAPHWEAMDDCLIKKVKLQSSSEEYKDVVRNFSKTAAGYTVLKVERIQNRYLWVSYCWKRSWMEKKNPERIQNERILYHGTAPENCDSIQEIGFKCACRKITLYGEGIYFAEEASRSAHYAKPDPWGYQFMFQARVLTGEYGRGAEKLVLPPMKPSGGGRYDSLVNALSKPAIFVTFFDDHAYPEYLITFRG
ncbi:uncharacterized protein [Tiliqua scincoides]|uniref:uncharacterized protein isoform X2 n=1 Tax=Tiliqua scincoides TaxID=71010 RepID=UPI0034625D31